MSYTFDQIIDEVVPQIKVLLLEEMEKEIHYASPAGQAEEVMELEGYALEAKAEGSDYWFDHYTALALERQEQSPEEWASCKEFSNYQGDRVLWEATIEKAITSFRKKFMRQLKRLVKKEMVFMEITDVKINRLHFLVQTPKGVRRGEIRYAKMGYKGETEVTGYLFRQIITHS